MQPTDPVFCLAVTTLSEAQQRRAEDRYAQLRPHLEQDVPLRHVAAQAGWPLRTAQRWVNRYLRFGLAGLSRTARADKGKRRRLSDELRDFAEGLALQRPRPGAGYREVCRVAQEKGHDPPSYHTTPSTISFAPLPARRQRPSANQTNSNPNEPKFGRGRTRPRAAAAPAQRWRVPVSLTIRSIGMSKSCGWIVSSRENSKPTPIANGRGASAARVRSK